MYPRGNTFKYVIFDRVLHSQVVWSVAARYAWSTSRGTTKRAMRPENSSNMYVTPFMVYVYFVGALVRRTPEARTCMNQRCSVDSATRSQKKVRWLRRPTQEPNQRQWWS